MHISPPGLTVPDATHHRVKVNGAHLHYVAAGTAGPPILLVHGFPETWWTFHHLIPLLAVSHRVFAVDLRGFGDSDVDPDGFDSRTTAEDLHKLIAHLDCGPVHLIGQDLAGATVFRLATAWPDDVLSLTGIEMGLAGFGLEALADVTHGGSWHIGVLAAPGVPEMLLSGRETEFLDWAFQALSATPDAIAEADIAEFTRSYERPNGFGGASDLYRSILSEGEALKAIAAEQALRMPVLAIGAGGGPLTADTLSQVSAREVQSVLVEGAGHYVALEAPEVLAQALIDFIAAQPSSNG